MQESLEVLKQYTIISPDDIESLRHMLLENHPNLTDAQRAQLFAKCLHKKLDEALASFDISLRKNIKHYLLQRTVSRASFAINAFDVLETCTQLEEVCSSHMNQLTSWVNQYEIRPLTEEMLLSLTQHLSDEHSSVPTKPFVLSTSSLPTYTQSHIDTLPKLLPIRSMLKYIYTKAQVCLSLLTICILLLTYTVYAYHHHLVEKNFSKLTQIEMNLPLSITLGASANYLQAHLQYKSFDESALKDWLKQRHSVLANEPYFSVIIDTAQSFDINPLLLFAITGQEQNFVPSTHSSALKMANNPFNLYGSWQIYNTSIEDAALIVSRTIIRLGKDCPPNQDQIQWINKSYAADPNWHIGVTYFLNELELASASSNPLTLSAQ